MKKHLGIATALAIAWIAGAFASFADEEPGPGGDGSAPPPAIVYEGSRASKRWLGKPGAPQVAVGEGVAWQGVTVYLSLTWDLVGVDVETDTVLYVQHVGAFWNALGFKQVTPEGAAKTWAVELRPGPRARQGAERRQYHDLRTGKKLEVPATVSEPSGTPFVPRAHWAGDDSKVARPFHLIASTEANWVRVQERMFGGADRTRFGVVDFEREVVLVCSLGNTWNTKGVVLRGAYEDDERVLVRTDQHSFQTIGGGMKARPWGICVLPRREKKAYVVERDVQGLIGGPSIWKGVFRTTRLKAPQDELADLPEQSSESHHGWEGGDERAPRLPPPPPPRQPR